MKGLTNLHFFWVIITGPSKQHCKCSRPFLQNVVIIKIVTGHFNKDQFNRGQRHHVKDRSRDNLEFLIQFGPSEYPSVQLEADSTRRPKFSGGPLFLQAKNDHRHRGRDEDQLQTHFLTNSPHGLRGHGHRDNSLRQDAQTKQQKRPFSFTKSEPTSWAAPNTVQKEQGQRPLAFDPLIDSLAHSGLYLAPISPGLGLEPPPRAKSPSVLSPPHSSSSISEANQHSSTSTSKATAQDTNGLYLPPLPFSTTTHPSPLSTEPDVAATTEENNLIPEFGIVDFIKQTSTTVGRSSSASSTTTQSNEAAENDEGLNEIFAEASSEILVDLTTVAQPPGTTPRPLEDTSTSFEGDDAMTRLTSTTRISSSTTTSTAAESTAITELEKQSTTSTASNTITTTMTLSDALPTALASDATVVVTKDPIGSTTMLTFSSTPNMITSLATSSTTSTKEEPDFAIEELETPSSESTTTAIPATVSTTQSFTDILFGIITEPILVPSVATSTSTTMMMPGTTVEEPEFAIEEFEPPSSTLASTTLSSSTSDSTIETTLTSTTETLFEKTTGQIQEDPDFAIDGFETSTSSTTLDFTRATTGTTTIDTTTEISTLPTTTTLSTGKIQEEPDFAIDEFEFGTTSIFDVGTTTSSSQSAAINSTSVISSTTTSLITISTTSPAESTQDALQTASTTTSSSTVASPATINPTSSPPTESLSTSFSTPASIASSSTTNIVVSTSTNAPEEESTSGPNAFITDTTTTSEKISSSTTNSNASITTTAPQEESTTTQISASSLTTTVVATAELSTKEVASSSSDSVTTKISLATSTKEGEITSAPTTTVVETLNQETTGSFEGEDSTRSTDTVQSESTKDSGTIEQEPDFAIEETLRPIESGNEERAFSIFLQALFRQLNKDETSPSSASSNFDFSQLLFATLNETLQSVPSQEAETFSALLLKNLPQQQDLVLI